MTHFSNKLKHLSFCLLWLLILCLPCLALESYIPVSGSRGYEEVSATTTTALGLTAVNIDNAGTQGMARVLITAFPAAVRTDGTAPISTTKQVFQVGQILYLESYAEMKNFQAIGIGGTSILAVQYYQRLP